MKIKLIREFQKRFQTEPQQIFFCPGRVNLIGEHIDYNGGRVMPCAISMGTWLGISKNKDMRLRFQCLNFPETAELHLQESYSKAGKQWFNYPLGVINELIQSGHPVSGMNMLFYGNLPIGAGLSSSASIEVLTAFAINESFGLNLSLKDIALLCRKVENEFIGVNCGVMDQFAVAFGKKEKAILLNCDTLDYEYLPLETAGYTLAILNTNKPRNLIESKYNERFAECGKALKFLKKELPVSHLCALNLAEFAVHRYLINDSLLEKRALHVIAENVRVEEAADALKAGDLFTFGNLLYDSHQSLKELYEVTGKELDTIVDFCKSYNNCIGARMTGAGFGGCAIALIRENNFDEFAVQLSFYYEKKIGYRPVIFASAAEDGVRKIN